MANEFYIDDKAAEVLKDTVRKVQGKDPATQAGKITGQPNGAMDGKAGGRLGFLGLVKVSGNDGSGNHEWDWVQRGTGVWTAAAGGSNQWGQAIAGDGGTLATDTIAALFRATTTTGGYCNVLLPMTGILFAVDLAWDSTGSDGDPTTTPVTYPDWAYDVKAKGTSVVLETGLQPEKDRQFAVPTAKATKGVAYWNGATLVLWDTNEKPDNAPCVTG